MENLQAPAVLTKYLIQMILISSDFIITTLLKIKMETRHYKHAFVVGIFIVIAIAILVITVLTLGGEKKSFTKKIDIKVLFTEINGLKEVNNVWFYGVKIGTIKNIELKGAS